MVAERLQDLTSAPHDVHQLGGPEPCSPVLCGPLPTVPDRRQVGSAAWAAPADRGLRQQSLDDQQGVGPAGWDACLATIGRSLLPFDLCVGPRGALALVASSSWHSSTTPESCAPCTPTRRGCLVPWASSPLPSSDVALVVSSFAECMPWTGRQGSFLRVHFIGALPTVDGTLQSSWPLPPTSWVPAVVTSSRMTTRWCR